MKIDLKTATILLVLGFVWGSSFILMKRGLVSFSPMQVASLRLVFAGLVSCTFLIKYFKQLKGKDWLFLTLSGITGNFLPAFLFASAVSEIPSSLTGALNSMTPFFALIFGVLLFSQLFLVRQVIGISIGLAGALILILSKSETGFSFQTDYILPSLKVIFAALLYGLNVNIIKSKLQHLTPLINSMVPLTIISVPALFIALSQDFVSTLSKPEALHSLLFIAILGIIGTAASLIVFNQLLKKTSALFASSVTYLIPVFAYVGIIDGEPVGVFQIGGMLLILTGITLTKK
ncbi:MAG: DMT family transporter [Bacteroidia bacterium]